MASSSFASKFPALAKVTKPLVLNFDLNQTLIMLDPCSGKSLDDVLDSLLARIAWGKVDSQKSSTLWMYDASIPLGLSYGGATEVIEESGGIKLMRFEYFVDNVLHPPPEGFDALPTAERRAIWGDVTKARKAIKRGFTMPGREGAALRCEFDRMHACLKHEDGAAAYIIPSFFRAMNRVFQELPTTPLYIVLRSMGADGPEVAAELNSFLRGEHPHAKLAVDPAQVQHLLIPETRSGQYTREEGKITLRWSDGTEWCETIPQLQTRWEALFEQHPRGAGFNVRDHYDWWAAGREACSCGKPIAVDSQCASYHTLFFDDNIVGNDSGRGIVDCRDAVTGQTMPWSRSKAYLVDFNAYRAIVDDEYMLECIDERIKLQESGQK